MSPNIFFFHQNNHCDCFGDHYPIQERVTLRVVSFTCAVDLDEIAMLMAWPEHLLRAIKSDKELSVNLGVTVCHPKDGFCYATGRSMALANMGQRRVRPKRYETEGDGGVFWRTQVTFDVIDADLEMVVTSSDRKPFYQVSFSLKKD